MRPSVARTAVPVSLGGADQRTVARHAFVRTSPPTRAAYASALTSEVKLRPVYVPLR